MKLICSFLIKKAVFLPGFSTLGSTGPIKKLKGGHKGEKWVTVYEYIIQEWIISRLSMRRNRYFIDAADGVFSKDAITN